MNEIQRQVVRARRRMNLSQGLRACAVAVTAGLLIGCLGFAVPRIWAVDNLQTLEQLATWQWAWALGVLVVSVAAGVAYAAWHAVRNAQAAMEIDQRFGLKDRLGSALTLSPADAATPAGRSLLEDAAERAARIDVRDQFPIQASRQLWWPLIPALVMVGLLFVPPRKLPEAQVVKETTAEKKQVELAIAETKKKIEEQARKLAEKGLDKAAEEVKAMARKLDELSPETSELKKETLVKLNDLKKQLENEKSKLGSVEDMQKEFGRLKDVAPGPGKEMAQALKDGDFEKAKEIVSDLAQKIKDGKLNESEQRELGKNLDELAKAVQDLTRKHEENKQQLEEMIKKALEESDPQKAAELQEKLDQLKKQDTQLKKMEEMAQKLEKCAECLNQGQGKPDGKQSEKGKASAGKQGDKGQSDSDKKGGEGQSEKEAGKSGAAPNAQQMQAAQKALDELQDMMEQIEKEQAAQEVLQDLEQDLEEGKGQCQNPGGNPNEQENGKLQENDFAKGGGRGAGKRDLLENETKGYKSQVKSKLQKGQTIVAGEAEGENAKVGSVVEARELVKASLAKESDPIEDQQLPKAQREQARQYFEKLRKGK